MSGSPGPRRRVVTPATTTRPPPRPVTHQRQHTCPVPSWTDGNPADAGRFPRSPTIDQPGRRPAIPRQHRHGYAAGLHHGLPAVGAKRLRSRPTPRICWLCAAHRPISTRLEPASLLRGVEHWFTSVTPSGLASTSPHRLAVPARRRLRQGRLPPSPPLRRSGCPQASTGLLRQPGGKVFHPPRSISATWRTAPPRNTRTRL